MESDFSAAKLDVLKKLNNTFKILRRGGTHYVLIQSIISHVWELHKDVLRKSTI